MISIDNLEKLSRQYQSALFPNIIREYFQHVFLSILYSLPDSNRLLFKGGTALRIIYGSPRFSEDLDFSLSGVPDWQINTFMEKTLGKALAEIGNTGINSEIGKKSGITSGGYFGIITFRMLDQPPLDVELNISSRSGDLTTGEIDIIANDFAPTYNIVHLPQNELVNEKIFGALLERKKPRDYYDLYFIMRKGMLSSEQKTKLSKVKSLIVAQAKSVDFRLELGAFLPADHQAIIRSFPRALEDEINRQIA
ncbi:MAG: nucleotidyl transferase AbiEii/AbiGii toxin family protein [Candidatus Margulisiibacteriota bacterium]